MKKLTLLFSFVLLSALSFGQVFTGVNWVSWANEPDYEGQTGYAENPLENLTYTVLQAPATWTPIADVAAFDVTWELLGDPNNVGNLTSNGVAGNLFDLASNQTFGAQWKAVHDGNKMYVLLQYSDLNAQADEGSLTFEIMAQPTSPVRHEPTFDAGVTAADMAKKNMAYARYIELGGGKALFKAGAVTEYAASIGTTGQWGANAAGLAGLVDEDHFWSNADGMIKAVLVMSFEGALSYPTDPADLETRTALKVGDVFAFDVKSNALKGGTANDNKIEYFWASEKNNGYASNYYSGHLTISPDVVGEDPEPNVVFTGVNWVSWANEPDYAGITGYDENPYENPEYTVMKAPASWTPVADAASFDATWDVLGEANNVGNLTSNGVAGDLFDLDAAETFGAQWKAVHDGNKMYVLLKYFDVDAQADEGTLSFEVMAQPKSPVRHEPTFQAGVTAADMAKKNMAYARYIELGGGKAAFKAGAVTEYAASIGTTGQWGANAAGLAGLVDEDHVWLNADGVIRAVLVMSFNGALAYPADPTNLDGDRTALKVGDVFAFDVKSNALKGGTADANKIEYFWASDKNNGYASNYYSGHLTISSVTVNINDFVNYRNDARVYSYNGVIFVKGSDYLNLEVYNVLGARVKSAENVRQLSIQDLNNGVYFVRINGEAQAVKVIKN